jgi:hypothetical protein
MGNYHLSSINCHFFPTSHAQVLKTFEPDQIASLSPSGIINGLYYLSDTDPSTWNAQQVAAAK